MKCFICEGEIIWGADLDAEHEEFLLETNYSCQDCGAIYFVLHGKLEQPLEENA